MGVAVMILNSGWCKGLKLHVPKGEMTRPTSGKVRESLLNMLISDLEGSIFIDLFAGTGSVGLSAVSRGAAGCIFVEKDAVACKALALNVAEAQRRANKQEIAVAPLMVLNGTVQSSYKRITGICSPKIVWADPPYNLTNEWLKESGSSLASLVAPGGFLALESSTGDLPSLKLDEKDWTVVRQRSFDESTLTVWQRKDEGSV
jgi:16S rRNA (guanine966-N2)-methyltransferase